MARPQADTYIPAALEAADLLGLAPADLRLVHVSENVTFKVLDSRTDRSVALRLHRPGYQSLEALQSERAWVRALGASGIRVPDAVTNGQGEELVSVEVEALGERRWVSASNWIDGPIMGALLDSVPEAEATALFVELGRLLGATHNQACAWRPPAGFTRHRLDAAGLAGARPVWGAFWKHHLLTRAEQALLVDVRDQIRDVLGRYGTGDATFGLIHADLHPGNIIVKDGALALIDFDDAAFGWHAFDMAVAMVLYLGHPSFETYLAACMRGYRMERAISDKDLSLVPMFILIRAMNQLGWFHERPDLIEPESIEALKGWICQEAATFKPPI